MTRKKFERSSTKNSTLNRPDVSVVVCHHTGDLLFGFIKSLKASEDVNFEVIVMTSDENLALKGISGCWVHHSTELPAAKRNAGVRLARAKNVAFFDDDVTIDPRCLRLLMNTLHFDARIGMVYGKLFNMEFPSRLDEAGGYLTSTGFIWSRAAQNEIDIGKYGEVEQVFAGKSASCIIHKNLFLEIGGFDEDFGILGEESDLSWRVWLSGRSVLFQPNATGLHAFNTKFKPPAKYYTSDRVHYNGARNYITMLFKNLETKNLCRILPLHLGIWIFAGLAMIGTLKIRQGVNILRGIGYFFSNWSSLYAKRKRVQRRRRVTDEEIWPAIYRVPPRGYYRTRILRYISLGLHG